MADTDADRSFYVGDPVRLVVYTKDPSGQGFVDPDDGVYLQKITRSADDVDVVDTPVAMTRISLGVYKISVDTTGWDAGIYTWVGLADGGSVLTRKQVRDYFVLEDI